MCLTIKEHVLFFKPIGIEVSKYLSTHNVLQFCHIKKMEQGFPLHILV